MKPVRADSGGSLDTDSVPVTGRYRHIAAAHLWPERAAGEALEWSYPSFVDTSKIDAGDLHREAQYTSDDYRSELDMNGIECSMSRRGNCYDNAVVESFFGALKRERVNFSRYLTRDKARADIFDYIECFYNRKRRHGYLGYVSPVDFENRTAGLS